MIKDNISISLNRKSLKYNPTPKILGLTLDEKLTFSSHINILEQKASRTVVILHESEMSLLLTSLEWPFPLVADVMG
jgi:hypothetical protein